LQPDGTADPAVTAYLASSDFLGLSFGSRVSYATDIKVFLSFLELQGTGWRDASHDTVLDYEYWRRRDAHNPRRVGGAKFARELAALIGFYRWQVTHRTLEASPILFITTRDRRGETVRRSRLQPTNVRSVKVKWLTSRAYRRWRDVGLAGYGSDGLLDTRWRGRTDGRNLAMCDFMWASGLRLREAGTLLVPELPRTAGLERYVRGHVAEAVAKGKARDYWVSRKAIQRIAGYVTTTRAEAVRRAQAAKRYDDIRGLIIVTGVKHTGEVTYEDTAGKQGRTHLDSLDSRERMLLFERTDHGVEPLALWLSEAGLPMPYLTWEAIFARATDRCEAKDVPIACHPHMLRHSFALRMLVTYKHTFDRRYGLTEEQRLEYRELFGDEYVFVQTLLGHASVSITKDCYLEPVQGANVDMFLNGETDEDSIEELLERIARSSPRVQDVQ
jgi:site-specific recombinase XerD